MKTKKRLGQHFLTDGTSIRQIVDAAQIATTDLVVEIGPGRGALTQYLVDMAGEVIAIEVDRELSTLLASQYGSRLKVILDDVQQVNLTELVDTSSKDKAVLVGNLPYQITGALIRQITDARRIWKRAVIMVQREVGHRMVADPGSKVYGVLSIVTQIRCVVKHLFDLPPEYFYPAPKVHSSVLLLDFEIAPKHEITDEDRLFGMVRAAFQKRRKMIRNALGGLVDECVLAKAGIDGKARPETISIDGFERLCRALPVLGEDCG